MSRCRIGTTVIDALKLCYMVNVEDLSALTGLGYGELETIGDFSFFRVASKHFAYSYNILHGLDEDRHEVAQLRFARHEERQEGTMYAFLHALQIQSCMTIRNVGAFVSATKKKAFANFFVSA